VPLLRSEGKVCSAYLLLLNRRSTLSRRIAVKRVYIYVGVVNGAEEWIRRREQGNCRGSRPGGGEREQCSGGQAWLPVRCRREQELGSGGAGESRGDNVEGMTRGTAGLFRENCRDCLQNQRRDILLEQLMHGHQGKGIPDQVFQLPSGASS
jgi:hypothetical protein